VYAAAPVTMMETVVVRVAPGSPANSTVCVSPNFSTTSLSTPLGSEIVSLASYWTFAESLEPVADTFETDTWGAR
jgi:hypothetical protein